MELNEYERQLWAVLSNGDDFEIDCLSDYLTNAYFNISYEYQIKQLMLAVSYLKRLILKVLEKRGIKVNIDEKDDLETIVQTCLNEQELLVGLDISKILDEQTFGAVVDKITDSYDYEEFAQFTLEFYSFYGSFYRYLQNNIITLVSSYVDMYYEVSDPEPDDLVLDTIFGQEGFDLDVNEVSDSEFEDDIFDLSDSFEEDNELFVFSSSTKEDKKELSEKELIELLKFLNTIFDAIKIKDSISNNYNLLFKKVNKKKVEMFFSDEVFFEKFKAIMEHDTKTHRYRFHGTTCLDDAKSICEHGLGVMRRDLDSTTYTELTMEQVIVHERGFGGEIGRDAYIIIDEPRGEKILEPYDGNLKIVGSGLQGLEVEARNIVRSKYIVGYVDKLNRDIIFNPEYYDYERFSQYVSKKSV